MLESLHAGKTSQKMVLLFGGIHEQRSLFGLLTILCAAVEKMGLLHSNTKTLYGIGCLQDLVAANAQTPCENSFSGTEVY